MQIFLTRHGLTDWNVKHKAQGRIDVPLNSVGREQAKNLQTKIQNLPLTVCYVSPLQRAAETAKIAVNTQCEIITDDRLIERCFGDYEGADLSHGWLAAAGVDIGDLKLNTDENNLEPVKAVLARTRLFLNELYAKHAKDDVVLVVSHGQTIRALHWNLVGYDDNTNWWDCKFDNTELRGYTLDKPLS